MGTPIGHGNLTKVEDGKQIGLERRIFISQSRRRRLRSETRRLGEGILNLQLVTTNGQLVCLEVCRN